MAHKRKVNSKPKVKKDKTVKDRFPVNTLSEAEVNQFKALLQLSNNVATIKKGLADKELMLKQLKEVKKKIDKKEIKAPLFAKILPDVYAPYNDMKSVDDTIKRNINMIETALKLEEGQLEHRYEEYVIALIQMIAKLDSFKGKEKIKDITLNRVTTKDEQQVFEQSFDKFIKNESKKQESKK